MKKLKPDIETIAKTLDAVNLRFYEAHHSSFHSTRKFGWPGWKSVVETMQPSPKSVLDVGCGNGRFARFLDSVQISSLPPSSFVGLDQNTSLLGYAQTEPLSFPAKWIPWTWSERTHPCAETSQGVEYDLVTAFGILHHIYGQARREAFIQWCSSRVAPGGYLVVSAWDFGRHPRFASKTLSAQAVFDETGLHLSDLEPNDHFLGFGQSTLPMRYCHWVDDAEADALIGKMNTGSPPFDTHLRLEDPADLNRYWVWRRP